MGTDVPVCVFVAYVRSSDTRVLIDHFKYRITVSLILKLRIERVIFLEVQHELV